MDTPAWRRRHPKGGGGLLLRSADRDILTQVPLFVELALEPGIAKDRIDSTVDFLSIAKFGVKGEGGAAEAVAVGELVVPIQRTYPHDEVRAGITELEAGHMAGKIVLIP